MTSGNTGGFVGRSAGGCDSGFASGRVGGCTGI